MGIINRVGATPPFWCLICMLCSNTYAPVKEGCVPCFANGLHKSLRQYAICALCPPPIPPSKPQIAIKALPGLGLRSKVAFGRKFWL